MAIIHEALHPGEIVKDALFNESNLTVTEAARLLQVDRTTLSRLLNCHSGISADMACRLGLLLGTSAEMWMNIQKDYELSIAYQKNNNLKIKQIKYYDKSHANYTHCN